MLIDGLARLFGELELHRATCLALSCRCALEAVPVRSDVLDTEPDDITTAELAVNRHVEQRQVADPLAELQPGPDRPDVPWLEWRLLTNQLSSSGIVACAGIRMLVLNAHCPSPFD